MNEDLDAYGTSMSKAEKEIEQVLRPDAFASFAGQEQVVANLRVFVQAAAQRGESLDHVLLHGPPGLGKTTLSHIIANELGVNMKMTSGPVLDKPGNLAGLLTSLEKNDVLFIDEIHRLLYFLVTGVPPFDDPDVPEILRKQCEAPFPPPSQRAPKCDIPQEVVSFLRKTMAKSPVDRFESWEEFLSELKKVRKAVSGKGNAPARGAARSTPTVKTAAVKAAGSAGASKASPLDQLNAAPVTAKQKKSRIFLAINYLLISLLTVGAIAFMLARSNTQSAENRLIEMHDAMNNVREKDRDPEGAKDKIKRARAESRKFGVKKEVIQKVEQECAAAMQYIEELEAENRDVGQILLDVNSLMGEFEAARIALKRNRNEKNISELKRIRAGFQEQANKIAATLFERPSNREKMQQLTGAINARIKDIDDLVTPASGSGKTSTSDSLSAFGSTAATAAADPVPANHADAAGSPGAGRKGSAADGGTTRRKKEEASREQYRKAVEQEKERVARELVREIRKGKLKDAESLLAAARPGMKVPDDPDCRDMEKAYTAWLAKLCNIFHEAEPVLQKVTPDASDNDKKAKINSLTKKDKRLRCHALILFGYFTEAQELAVQAGDQELLRDISVAYLTYRLKRAVPNALKGNGAELSDLQKEYKGFEPFKDLEKSIRARCTGGK